MGKPIGIFDSGIGGTSIWKEINHLLPNEDTLYLADSKNAPYGEKSKKEILKLSIKNTELLLQRGSKLIVVACNTATTNAIDYLRKTYPVPFIGIEPAIKPAALHTKTKKVGVLATKGTLTSSLFHNTAKIHASGIQILEQEGCGLVELIESGLVATKQTEVLLRKYVEPMLAKDIDCLVLGCTHYPYLIPILRKILPKNVQIIDSGQAVAKQTKAVLERHELVSDNIGSKTKHIFYSNHNKTLLESFLNTKKAEVAFLDF